MNKSQLSFLSKTVFYFIRKLVLKFTWSLDGKSPTNLVGGLANPCKF